MLSRRTFLAASAGVLAHELRPFARRVSRVRRSTPHGCGRVSSTSARSGAPRAATFDAGVSRVAYSDADLAARAWLLDGNATVPASPRGSIRPATSSRAGSPAGCPSVRPGDSVRLAHRFGAQPAATSTAIWVRSPRSKRSKPCQAADATPTYPLEMVLWAHEESTAFGRGTAASRIVAGDLQAGDLDQMWNGLRRADGIRRIGGDPARIEEAVRQAGTWHAYLELHIEQGGTLEKSGRSRSGSSKASSRFIATTSTVTGFANHAGTTPMDERQDALLRRRSSCSRFAKRSTARPGRQVGTVGPPRGHAELAERHPRQGDAERRASRSFRGRARSARRGHSRARGRASRARHAHRDRDDVSPRATHPRSRTHRSSTPSLAPPIGRVSPQCACRAAPVTTRR